MATKNYGATPSAAADSVTLGDVRVHGFWSAELHVRESVVRTTGTMDAPLGVTAPVALTVTDIYARYGTANASGTSTIQIYKNGSSSGMPSITITGTTLTGNPGSGLPITLSQYDVLTAGVTATGTTPGTGLSVTFTGYV
jgi:hypothetical protein